MNSMPITAVVFMFIGFIMISAIGYFVCYFGGKHIGYRRGYNTAKQESNKVYYLAYFKINADGDFYFEPYMGLNDDYMLFESPDEALEAIKRHLKLAIDTFARPWAESTKDSMVILYDELFGDESEKFDEESNTFFYIDTDRGNYGVTYFIKRVSVL